ncbi:hypothetical protein JCM3775_003904 [Rhodotorula graminis]
MSRRDSTSSDGPTWQPGSRDSQPPFVYDDPQPMSDSDRVDGFHHERQPRALHRHTTSGDLRTRSSSSRTIRPAARRSSKTATHLSNDDGDDAALFDGDDEHDGLFRSRSSSAERSRSRSPVDSHHSSVAYRDFPSPPGYKRDMYTPSPTRSTRNVRRISSIEDEERQREQHDDGSWFASDSGSGSDDERAGAPGRPRSLSPFKRESSEDERRRIAERLEEQKKLREGRAPTSPHEREAAFLAAVQTHQAERDGRHTSPSNEQAWRQAGSRAGRQQQQQPHAERRAERRPSDAVNPYFGVKHPDSLDSVGEDDAGAQSDGAPERERRAKRLNAAHRERLQRGSRMHGRLRDSESLYDLEGGPLAAYFNGDGDSGEEERRGGRDGAGSSRRSGSRRGSSRPRASSDTEEHFDGMSKSLSGRAETIRANVRAYQIRNARLGPKDLPREPKALAWVKQHEYLTGGLVVLVLAVLAVAGWAIWWAAVGSKQGAYVGA